MQMPAEESLTEFIPKKNEKKKKMIYLKKIFFNSFLRNWIMDWMVAFFLHHDNLHNQIIKELRLRAKKI